MKAISLSIMLLFLAQLHGCTRSGSGSMDHSGSSYNPVDYSRTEEEIKEDLVTRERSNPASYLSFEGTYRPNLIGETVIEGMISNSAKIAKFKDAVLHVTGYSKTNSTIGTWAKTVYEVFYPGRNSRVKVKLFLPSDVKTIQVSVSDATATD